MSPCPVVGQVTQQGEVDSVPSHLQPRHPPLPSTSTHPEPRGAATRCPTPTDGRHTGAPTTSPAATLRTREGKGWIDERFWPPRSFVWVPRRLSIRAHPCAVQLPNAFWPHPSLVLSIFPAGILLLLLLLLFVLIMFCYTLECFCHHKKSKNMRMEIS